MVDLIHRECCKLEVLSDALYRVGLTNLGDDLTKIRLRIARAKVELERNRDSEKRVFKKVVDFPKEV